jgi:hypothetical protein
MKKADTPGGASWNVCFFSVQSVSPFPQIVIWGESEVACPVRLIVIWGMCLWDKSLHLLDTLLMNEGDRTWVRSPLY